MIETILIPYTESFIPAKFEMIIYLIEIHNNPFV